MEFGALRVFSPTGARVDEGAPTHPGGRGEVVAVGLNAGLPHGTYTVSWRVVSADSHPVSGAFTFSVGTPSATVLGPSALNEGGSRLVSAVYGVVRGLAYMSFAVLVGASTFLFVCWPAGSQAPTVRRLLIGAWAVLLLTTIATLALQGPYAAGFGIGRALDPTVLHHTLGTRLGHALILRLGALAAAAAALAWIAVRLSTAPVRRRVILGGSCSAVVVTLASTWAWADHAGTGPQPALAIPADVLHLTAMAVWLGGLVLLAAVVLRKNAPLRRGDLAIALPRFSVMAFSGVCALVITGIYQAWRRIGTLAALAGNAYGRLLLLKLLGVLLLIGLGYIARSWIAEHIGHGRFLPTSTAIRPSDRGLALLSPTVPKASDRPDTAAVSRLRRSVAIETVVATAVLALSAALVNTEPPHPTHRTPLTAPFATPGTTGTVSILIDPAKAGPDTIHLAILDPASRPESVPEVRASLRLPARSIGPLPLALTASGPGHYTATTPIPIAGSWQLAVTVRTDDLDETTVTIPVAIR